MSETGRTPNPDPTAPIYHHPSTENISKKEDDSKKDTHVEVNSEEDEQTDDVKVSEKSLLEENEKNQEIAISIDDHERDNSPLPTKKGEFGRPEPPSIFVSPFARMKYDWQYSGNLVEFFTRVICVIFASVGWIVLVGGIPFLSLIQLIIGAVYLNDCPADDRIPIYQVVAGVFGIILHCMAAFTKYMPNKHKEATKAHRRRCMCIETILQIFLFIFFVAGCTWVYSIYEPDYVNTDHGDYCHKGLYLFSFWMFNLTFIILLSIVAFGICGVAFVTFNNSPPEKIVVKK